MYIVCPTVIANPSTMVVAHTTSGIRFNILAVGRPAIWGHEVSAAPAVLSCALRSGSGLEAEPYAKKCTKALHLLSLLPYLVGPESKTVFGGKVRLALS